MKTLKVESARELKRIERSQIININGVVFGKVYPILEVSGKHASYYSPEKQANIYISFPANVELNTNIN